MSNDADEVKNGAGSGPSQPHQVIPDSEVAHDSPNETTTSDEDAKSVDVEDAGMEESRELTPPPLPPRPNLDLLDDRAQLSGKGSLRVPKRPQLLSKATTALSLAGTHAQIHQEDNSLRSSPTGSKNVSRKPSTIGRSSIQPKSDGDDSTSIKSFAPTLDQHGDLDSLFGDALLDQSGAAWKSLSAQVDREDPFKRMTLDDDLYSLRIRHEFDELDAYDPNGMNEGMY